MGRPQSANPSEKTLYMREWAARNREKARAYALAYKTRNLERVREQNKESARKRRAENPLPSREAAKRWREKNPIEAAISVSAAKARNPDKYEEILKRADFRRKCKRVGITSEEYASIAKRQNFTCAICQESSVRERLSIDHDHRTGKFRGLICHHCNTGLGMFHDNPTLLRTAAQYIDAAASGEEA